MLQLVAGGLKISDLQWVRKSEVEGRCCAVGRDLTGFDLDRGNTSSRRSDLVLEGIGLGLEVWEFII